VIKQVEITPEYFPGLESMAHIGGAEACIVRIGNQYSSQSYQNRTRIRNADGWQWLTIPIPRGQFGAAICETRPAAVQDWKTRHLKGLRYNYSTSPYYDHYIDELKSLLDSENPMLSDLTVRTMRWALKAVGFGTSLELSSEASTALHEERQSGYDHPEYRQNFDGFIPQMSVLDVLFNHGPESKRIIMDGVRQ